ncbi:MAG: UvrD-helicase domain-containing protein [Bacilli bacterium]|nr:UvrD-helicase domain-containing protein [Bacilli bacterium]MBN2695941.1 UvrD-helicase domain-containing protein [Bacilli bacterium]
MNRFDHLTESQSKAVFAEGANILVSAGAGSGKTTVLSERVIRKLMDGVKIDDLIILTFTNLAAQEMKIRIKTKLKALPELAEELKRIDNARISTFDAFALRIVNDHHHLLGLPENIGIADKVLIDRLKSNCLEQTIMNAYQNQQPSFVNLVKRLFDRGDKALYLAIQTIVESIETNPEADTYLDRSDEYFARERMEDIVKSFTNMIIEDINDIRTDWTSLSDILQTSQNHRVERYQSDLEGYFSGLLAATDLEKLIAFFSAHKFPAKLRKGKDLEEDFLEDLDTHHGLLKDRLMHINKLFAKLKLLDGNTAMDDLHDLSEPVVQIAKLVKDYRSRVADEKRAQNLYEYLDIMNYAIRLFMNNDELLSAYKNRINEIMVDEYQDTNDLQEFLLNLLAEDNLFMVGDIKQSIYGFRNANPDNFLRKYLEYRNENEGIAIDLLENFRSRKQVLAGIDSIFQRTMSNDIGGIDYRDGQSMRYGFTDYDDLFGVNVDYSPELLYYDSDELPDNLNSLSSSEIEGKILSNDIIAKLDSNYQVYDTKKKRMRNVELSDFAIIADRRSGFETIRKTLVGHGLPVVVFSDEEFSASEEIQFVWHFVRLASALSGKYDIKSDLKLAFIGLARSFVYRIKDAKIFEVVVDDRLSTINDLKILAEDGNFTKLVSDLIAISEIVDRYALSDILERVYSITEIFVKLHLLDNPAARERKLDYLHERSASLSAYGLSDFAEYLDYIFQKADLDIEYAKTENQDEAAIKIMTMHKSKGLEFPICYYFGLDKRFNYSENKNLFRYDKDFGIFTKSTLNGYHDTVLHHIVDTKEYLDYVSERIRLFYVALTRAREKQILIINRKKIKEKQAIYDDLGYIRKSIRSRYRSYGDLLANLDVPTRWWVESDISDKYRKIPEVGVTELGEKPVLRSFSFHPKPIISTHFSKIVDDALSLSQKQAIDVGKQMHANFERLDFSDLENSLGSLKPHERAKIERLLSHDLFKDIEKAKVYQEHPFVFIDGTTEKFGIIDLLLVWEHIAVIIDFKLKNLDSSAYEDQLQGYRQYVKKMVSSPVKAYLYSFVDETLQEVRYEDDNLS